MSRVVDCLFSDRRYLEWQLVVIMLICLILFGGRKLPEIGSGVGKAIRNFRGATKEATEELQAPGEKKN